MATITGLTAARMAAIEAASIVAGAIVGDDLILTRQSGATVNAGNVRGPVGPSPSLVTTLPGSPTDGQVIYYQTSAMAALGYIWTLRYKLSTNKWEFVGGGSQFDRKNISQIPAGSGTFYELSTGSPSSLTIPVAGVYDIWFGASGQENTGTAVAGDALVILYKNGAAVTNGDDSWARVSGGYDKWSVHCRVRLTLAANDVIRPRGSMTSASWASFIWKHAYVEATPVTIG